MEFKHYSVLLEETVDGLNIKPDGIYVDGTLGGGGHAYEVCSRLNDKGRFIGIDQDEAAIKAAPTIITVNELFTRCKHYPKNPSKIGCELLTSRICEFKGRCSFYTPAEENPAPQGLPEKLRSARKERGLSIEQLGEQIGISRQRIGKWERGDGRPSPENLEKLAAIFGVSVEYLTA